MKKLFFYLACMLVGCGQAAHETEPQNSAVRDSAADSPAPAAKLGLEPLLNDSADLHFTDQGSFWFVYFKNRRVCMDYYPQCGSCFQAEIQGDKIRIYWNTMVSGKPCVDLATRFRHVKSPQVNRPFAELRVVGDSSFVISYEYPEWIDSMNAKESAYIDTLFPRFFSPMR